MDPMDSYEIMTEEQVKMTVEFMLQEHLKEVNDKLNSLTNRVLDSHTLMQEILKEIRLGRAEGQNSYQTVTSELKKELMTEIVDNNDGKIGSIGVSQAPPNRAFTIPSPTTKFEDAKVSPGYGDALSRSSLIDGINMANVKPSIDDTYGEEQEFSPTRPSVLRSDVRRGDIHQNKSDKAEGSGGHCISQDNSRLLSGSSSRLGCLSTEWNRKCQKEGSKLKDMSVCKTATSLKGPDRTRVPAQRNTVEKVALRGCLYCPRKFQHSHSLALHVQSCKKKFETTLQPKKGSENANLSKLSSSIDNDNRYPKFTPGVLRKPSKMNNMIRCRYCDRNFPTCHQVRSHERVHTGDRPYSCYVCSITFAHGGNMIKHIKSKHPSYNPYVCKHCKANFKTHENAHQHRKVCAPPRKPTVESEIMPTPNVSGDHADIVDGETLKRGRESEETVTASEYDEEAMDQMDVSPLRPTTGVEMDSLNSARVSTVSEISEEIIPVLMSISMSERMNRGNTGSDLAATVPDETFPDKMHIPGEFQVQQSQIHQSQSELQPSFSSQVENVEIINAKNDYLSD